MTNKETFLSFMGRLNRQRYIVAVLCLCLFQIVFQIGAAILLTGAAASSMAATLVFALLILILMWSYTVLAIKRLHDIDKSGWNLLWALLPLIGGILLIYWIWFKKGTYGANKYGKDLLLPADVAQDNVPLVAAPSATKVVIIVAIIAIIISGLFASITYSVKSSAPYLASEKFIKENAQIQAELGEIQQFGMIPSGQFKYNGAGGEGVFAIKVIGSNASAVVNLHLVKRPNEEWLVDKYNLLKFK